MRSVDEALDEAWSAFQRDAVEAGLAPLSRALARARAGGTPEEWSATVARVRRHPLCRAVHEDPFTFRCFSRPRGYPGDGVALDYVLKGRQVPGGARAARPALVHGFMTSGPFARALRFRRDQLARQIDEQALRTSRPARILAAWAGHLRELDGSAAAREGRLGPIVAFDHDGQNLAAAREEHPKLPIEAVIGSLRELVEGRHAFIDLDLVYCSGALETLPPAPAQGLVRALFEMVARGGRLVVPSLLPTLPDAALLEAFFDWRLALRAERDVFALTAGIPREEMGSWLYSANDESTLGVLVVERRR